MLNKRITINNKGHEYQRAFSLDSAFARGDGLLFTDYCLLPTAGGRVC